MKKVLFFVDDYGGGAGNVVQILANQFYIKGKFQPIIVFLNPHSQNNNKLLPNIQVIEYTMYKNKSRNKLLFLYRNLKTIHTIVEDVKADYIISFLDNINTNVCLSLFFKRSIPIIVCERSNPLIIKPYGMYRYLRPLAYIRANLISVQFEYFKDFMPAQTHKMVVTPNPIKKASKIKQTYDFNITIEIISCARLAEIKQLDKMIKAFAILHEQIPSVRLTIYGEGSERMRLEALIASLRLKDCVKLPGAVNDVYSALCNADIYIMTSRQEGFPNALSEAMACGLPVVSFECHKGLRELIDNYKNGILIDPNDQKALIDTLKLLIIDKQLREKLGKNAVYVSDKFSVDNLSLMWESLLHKIS